METFEDSSSSEEFFDKASLFTKTSARRSGYDSGSVEKGLWCLEVLPPSRWEADVLNEEVYVVVGETVLSVNEREIPLAGIERVDVVGSGDSSFFFSLRDGSGPQLFVKSREDADALVRSLQGKLAKNVVVVDPQWQEEVTNRPTLNLIPRSDLQSMSNVVVESVEAVDGYDPLQPVFDHFEMFNKFGENPEFRQHDPLVQTVLDTLDSFFDNREDYVNWSKSVSKSWAKLARNQEVSQGAEAAYDSLIACCKEMRVSGGTDMSGIKDAINTMRVELGGASREDRPMPVSTDSMRATLKASFNSFMQQGPETKTAVMLWDFDPNLEKTFGKDFPPICVRAGEVVQICTSLQSAWVGVRKDNGEEGRVPSSYLKVLPQGLQVEEGLRISKIVNPQTLLGMSARAPSSVLSGNDIARDLVEMARRGFEDSSLDPGELLNGDPMNDFTIFRRIFNDQRDEDWESEQATVDLEKAFLSIGEGLDNCEDLPRIVWDMSEFLAKLSALTGTAYKETNREINNYASRVAFKPCSSSVALKKFETAIFLVVKHAERNEMMTTRFEEVQEVFKHLEDILGLIGGVCGSVGKARMRSLMSSFTQAVSSNYHGSVRKAGEELLQEVNARVFEAQERRRVALGAKEKAKRERSMRNHDFSTPPEVNPLYPSVANEDEELMTLLGVSPNAPSVNPNYDPNLDTSFRNANNNNNNNNSNNWEEANREIEQYLGMVVNSFKPSSFNGGAAIIRAKQEEMIYPLSEEAFTLAPLPYTADMTNYCGLNPQGNWVAFWIYIHSAFGVPLGKKGEPLKSQIDVNWKKNCRTSTKWCVEKNPTFSLEMITEFFNINKLPNILQLNFKVRSGIITKKLGRYDLDVGKFVQGDGATFKEPLTFGPAKLTVYGRALRSSFNWNDLKVKNYKGNVMRIVLDKRIYYPGETVTGVFVMNVKGRDKPTDLKQLTFEVQGQVMTKSWYTYSCGSSTCTEYVYDYQSCLSGSVNPITCSKELPKTLHAGLHVWRFQLLLGSNMPATFDFMSESGSRTWYKVRARVGIKGKKVKVIEEGFRVCYKLPDKPDIQDTTQHGSLVFKTGEREPIKWSSKILTAEALEYCEDPNAGKLPIQIHFRNNAKRKKIGHVWLKIWLDQWCSVDGYSQARSVLMTKSTLLEKVLPGQTVDQQFLIKLGPNFRDVYSYSRNESILGNSSCTFRVEIGCRYGVRSATTEHTLFISPYRAVKRMLPPPVLKQRETELVVEREVGELPQTFFL